MGDTMIKNVILDMGNVLLNYNPQIPLDLYCDSTEEKEIIRKELFEGPVWCQGDIGLVRNCEMYDQIKSHVPEKFRENLKKCCEHWYVCMTELEGAGDFCDDIRKNGYRIFVLSNASDAFYQYFPGFRPLDYFDGIVVSSDVHMVKPDPEIYRYLLETYNLKPEECLFIDDVQDNVEGARSVGMHAFRFRGSFNEIKKRYSL